MFETIKNCFKNKDIRKKIWFTLLLLLAFRIGCYIPVPGIDAGAFREVIQDKSFLEIMSAISGGSLTNATLFALGISPYINASIIIQLLSVFLCIVFAVFTCLLIFFVILICNKLLKVYFIIILVIYYHVNYKTYY